MGGAAGVLAHAARRPQQRLAGCGRRHARAARLRALLPHGPTHPPAGRAATPRPGTAPSPGGLGAGGPGRRRRADAACGTPCPACSIATHQQHCDTGSSSTGSSGTGGQHARPCAAWRGVPPQPGTHLRSELGTTMEGPAGRGLQAGRHAGALGAGSMEALLSPAHAEPRRSCTPRAACDAAIRREGRGRGARHAMPGPRIAYPTACRAVLLPALGDACVHMPPCLRLMVAMPCCGPLCARHRARSTLSGGGARMPCKRKGLPDPAASTLTHAPSGQGSTPRQSRPRPGLWDGPSPPCSSCCWPRAAAK